MTYATLLASATLLLTAGLQVSAQDHTHHILMCNEETYYGDCTYIHVAEYTCYPVWPTNIRSVMPPAEDKSIMVQFFTESDWHGDSRAGVPVEWPGGISLGKEVQEAGYFMAIVKA